MEVNYAGIFCDNTIRNGKSACLIAVGTSMWPIITKGMKAVISPLESGLPPRGSLVLIEHVSGLMVHRYWGLTYREGVPLVLTKGDTNLAFDPLVPISMVLGQVSLLKNNTGDYRDPNHGWLCLLGRIICSSYSAARVWARLCRLLLKINSLRNFR